MTSDYETQDDYDARLEMYVDVVEDEYDGSDIYQTIDDTLDGMIHNYIEALHVLMHSDQMPDNWDAYVENDAMAESVEGHLVNLAYMTLRADLNAELTERDNGIDV